MKIQRLGVEALGLRTETRHRVGRQRSLRPIHQVAKIVHRSANGGILIPRAVEDLLLIAQGQCGLPPVRYFLTQRETRPSTFSTL